MPRLTENSFSTKAAMAVGKMISPLEEIGINRFNHDITYGDERISFITSNPEFFKYYYKNEFPLMCTNRNGRILKDGIYLSQNLRKFSDYSTLYPIVGNRFNFKHALHIVEVEEDKQHFYTFATSLDESEFLNLTVNKIELIKKFINFYKIYAKDIIQEAKKPKNIIKLPYCDSNKIIEFTANKLVQRNFQIENPSAILSRREHEILIWLNNGKTIEQLSEILQIKEITINKHIANIKMKTGCYTQFQLGAFYSRILEQKQLANSFLKNNDSNL